MKTIPPFFRFLAVAVAAAAAVGCVYVDPSKRNPAHKEDYTRAETIAAASRLSAKLFGNEGFRRRYAEKRAERQDGSLPTVQVAFVENENPNERRGSLALFRQDLETALLDSGWFELSGDPDACDYVMRGSHRDVRDGRRVTHQISLRLVDFKSDKTVWTGSDEIAKR